MARQIRRQQLSGKKPFNGWKWALIILLALLLGSGLWFGKAILSPVNTTPQTQTTSVKNDPVFTVALTRQRANRIVAYYLKHYLKDSAVKYTLAFNDRAVLSGDFKFLGTKVGFNLDFEPLVLKNGDVLLRAQSLNVGKLPVPVSYVLSYIGNSYKLPKWVGLNSKAGTVVLRLSQFKLENGMTFKATKLDLPGDDLRFGVYLPSEK